MAGPSQLRRFQLFIDGQWQDPRSGAWLASFNPATEMPWCEIPDCGEEDVACAVTAARRALSGPWGDTLPLARGRILRNLADALPGHADRLAELEVCDAGKNLTESRNFIRFCASYFQFFGELADKTFGKTFPTQFPGIDGHTHRVPVGVVAAIVPWNNPLWLLAMKLGPAIAGGNTVVIKPSEICSAPVLEMIRLMHEVADIPAGVINVVTGTGEPCGRALTAHPEVDKVAFTGGLDTARRIVANTAHNLAETSLELGGKSPVIIFPDADMDNAVENVVAGVFAGSSGQSCVAGSRGLVHRSIFEDFTARLVSAAESLTIGDPRSPDSRMGPLATPVQVQRCRAAVEEALSQGAVLKTGGKSPARPSRGWYFEPTVLVLPDHGLPIAHTELFGPVIVLIPFDTEEEALALANDTRYGLGAGIFTTNLGIARRMTRKIRAGIQWVNCYRLGSPMGLVGGFGDSGKSREAGLEAMDEYTRLISVYTNITV